MCTKIIFVMGLYISLSGWNILPVWVIIILEVLRIISVLRFDPYNRGFGKTGDILLIIDINNIKKGECRS